MSYKECWPFTLLPAFNAWHLLVYFFYAVALTFNALAAISLPYDLVPYKNYAYIAEIQWNEDMFTGSLNGIPVQNMTALRVSLATFC